MICDANVSESDSKGQQQKATTTAHLTHGRVVVIPCLGLSRHLDPGLSTLAVAGTNRLVLCCRAGAAMQILERAPQNLRTVKEPSVLLGCEMSSRCLVDSLTSWQQDVEVVRASPT